MKLFHRPLLFNGMLYGYALLAMYKKYVSRYPGPIIPFIYMYNIQNILKKRQNDSRTTARPHHTQLNATKLFYGVPFLSYFIQFILFYI